MGAFEVRAVEGLGEIARGADLGALIAAAARRRPPTARSS